MACYNTGLVSLKTVQGSSQTLKKDVLPDTNVLTKNKFESVVQWTKLKRLGRETTGFDRCLNCEEGTRHK